MSHATSRAVQLAIEDGVASLTLDDGKVNALSSALIAEIGAGLDEAEKAGALVVLRGRQGIFSAGFDLATFKRGPAAGIEMVAAGARLVLRLLGFPRPVLGVCTGHAYPAGAFLLLASDVRLGLSGDFRLGMNEVAIGLTLPRFAVELARHRLTPPGFARVTTGSLFGPEEAARFGYLDRVLEAPALERAVREETARLRALDMPSYVATKARINEHVVRAVRTALDEELGPAAG
jgi:enoyl-CoA hydratase